MRYPAVFEPAEEGGFVITFPDVYEAITQGDDEREGLDMAQDALITMFAPIGGIPQCLSLPKRAGLLSPSPTSTRRLPKGTMNGKVSTWRRTRSSRCSLRSEVSRSV